MQPKALNQRLNINVQKDVSDERSDDRIQKVTRTVCVPHSGPEKNMCAVSAITDVYFTHCFQDFFHGAVKYRSGLFVACSLCAAA